MKTIKIFSFPSHSPGDHISGVDYPRVIQPMAFLDGYSDGEVKFEVTAWDGKTIPLMEWGEICKKTDIVYLNYTVNDMMFASMGMMAEKYGVKVVMDLDDCLWKIGEDNSIYETYKKGSLGLATITDIINAVDHVTCTNGYLRNTIVNYTNKSHNQISVFPNYVNLKLYNHKFKVNRNPAIIVSHYGSSSHYSDLSNKEFLAGMDRIMKDYPNVQFLTVGSFFGKFKMKWGRRYNEEFGALNFMEWAKKRFPQVMAKTDIFVAPLNTNVYNISKSSIKFCEVSTTAKPGCWQDIRQYQEVVENGKNGFLCRTADDWYQSIKKLCDSVSLRKRLGENAFKTIKDGWQIKDHVKEYAKMFRSVCGI